MLSMTRQSDLAARLADALEGSWALKARPNQLPPEGDWSIWMLLAGRGYGKTRVLSQMANMWATSLTCKRIAIVAATAADCRDVMVEGESGILETAPSWCRPIYQASRRQVQWPNGAIATLYSAEEPDRLRGPQHDGALLDELASWRDPSTFDMPDVRTAAREASADGDRDNTETDKIGSSALGSRGARSGRDQGQHVRERRQPGARVFYPDTLVSG
jgi:phage terminase large subunit-like protein